MVIVLDDRSKASESYPCDLRYNLDWSSERMSKIPIDLEVKNELAEIFEEEI